ncbi:LuxR C-terminal-related transcriptional regulator [Thermogemmatispora onikobensis]|uniref:LuxR C-terminal-related transcriptional regulator n=1 Tax=Thermogemmatispora onikobensis TaxID=732234 RepID=UPI000852CDB1|nr:LuxR C-terminal-related transcriptional regulator [Thermogemmatispora onikobensis]
MTSPSPRSHSGSASRRLRRPLTRRQWQIVLLLRLGHSRRAIAAQLGLSPGTVTVQLAQLRHRLGLPRRSHLLPHIPWELCPPELLPPEPLPPLPPASPLPAIQAPPPRESNNRPGLLRGQRRWQVLLLLRLGLTPAQVARRLGVSRNTVYAHRQQVHERLDLPLDVPASAVLDYVPWEECPPELLLWLEQAEPTSPSQRPESPPRALP